MKNENYYTVMELANILGISRIAVFNKIKKGRIKAQKIGHMFVIPKKEVESIIGTALTSSQKKVVDNGVIKTIKEYKQVLELLGKE